MTEKTTKHSSLAAALAAFQADLPHVTKGAVNPHFKSRYADLADVVSVVLPRLAAQGLAWITRPTTSETGTLVLAYELRHESGEAVGGTYPLGSGTAQQLGSAITYARRYTLSAVTGIAPDEDDDGNQANGAVPSRDWAGDLAALVEARDVPGLKVLWGEARAAGAPQTFLDSVSTAGASLRESGGES